MTVKEMIKLLSNCDPESIVTSRSDYLINDSRKNGVYECGLSFYKCDSVSELCIEYYENTDINKENPKTIKIINISA